MTTERTFDRSLSDWFADATATPPPDDLLDRSLARLATVPQRPAMLTRELWLGRWMHVGRTRLPAPLVLVVAALLAAAVVVVGSQIVQPRLVVRTTESTPPPSAPVAPSPLPTADPRGPALVARAGTFANLREIHAFGDSVAWVATDSGIYRTDDAGATWRSVAPSGWVYPFDEEFVDADTAYVPIAGGRTVAATHDGGTTWVTTSIDEPADAAPILTFASAMRGFATFADPNHIAKADGTRLSVFTTTDGGATWTGPQQGLRPPFREGIPKVLPANGAFMVDSAASSDRTPFENWFNASEDGGASWTTYPFPGGPLSPTSELKSVQTIARGGDSQLLVTIDAAPAGAILQKGVWRNGPTASDWTLVQQLPESGDALVQYLDATTWVVTNGDRSVINATTDAGRTWRRTEPTMSLTATTAQNRGVSWGSIETGWTYLGCRPFDSRTCGDQPTYLLLTTDGGASWTEIGR